VAGWRFFQGLRSEWRWYALDESGRVVNSSDQAFGELAACMLNAAQSGFTGGAYQVHARSADGSLQPGIPGPRPDTAEPVPAAIAALAVGSPPPAEV
jgi:hypothetical protein